MNELYIKQIIPAPGNLFAQYTMAEGDIVDSKIVCLALMSDDRVVMMDSDDYGCVGISEGATNFIGVVYK